MKRRDFIKVVAGAASALPVAARAQPSAIPVIGYLSGGSLEPDPIDVIGFRQGLNESGYVEGQNVVVEYRWAEGQHDRLPALATDLVRRQVSVIATFGTPSTLAAKAATTTIPIVVAVGVDPVALGLVVSFSRPQGNITGFHVLNVMVTGKRIQLLQELLPNLSVLALITNPTSSFTGPETKEIQSAAQSLGLQLHVLNASNESEIETAFVTLPKQGAGALVVSADVPFIGRREQLVALAARHRMPTIYAYREFVLHGGLMSYGPNLTDMYRHLGNYAGQILKGTKVGELPIQQLVKVEFIINLKTAKALGLTFPLPLLGRADEVIE
jgi:putative tryptophan/tyrosine transport system substrate-binding protein